MTIIQRTFSGETDKPHMAALVRQFPVNNLHVVDLPYRLSSWAFDVSENVSMWVNEKHQLIAWAVLQTPFWAMDYAFHPNVDNELHRQILVWADERARKVLNAPSGRPMWFVNVFAGQTNPIRDLEEAGFTSQANVAEGAWSKVLMLRSAQTAIVDYSLPAGFTIRPLAGANEVEAYVELHRAVFQSNSMTVRWRLRTLSCPEYIADLDLVAVAPDGRLAAFCVGWLHKPSETEASGQIEPLGVHEDFRKLGLGRALLSEGLRRLHLHGAERVYIETDNFRNAAFGLYESAGFRVIQDVLVYRKDYESAQG